jgi:hypothetical protein
MSFGASLEEVWGINMDLPHGAAATSVPKQKKSQTLADVPASNSAKVSNTKCELYANAKKLDDIMNYIQDRSEPYEKAPTSRNQQPLPETDGADRGEGEKIATAASVVELPPERKMIYEGFQYQQQRREREYLDFALYVFSGVVLIFVLEQFIQIGINLQKQR